MVLDRKPEKKVDGVNVRPVGKDIGERISVLRRERHLSLEALAAEMGLTASYLSKLERESDEHLHFLGVEMVHFFKRDERLSGPLRP